MGEKLTYAEIRDLVLSELILDYGDKPFHIDTFERIMSEPPFDFGDPRTAKKYRDKFIRLGYIKRANKTHLILSDRVLACNGYLFSDEDKEANI